MSTDSRINMYRQQRPKVPFGCNKNVLSNCRKKIIKGSTDGSITRKYVAIHPSTQLELLTRSDFSEYERSLIQSLRINKNWSYSNNRDYYEVVNDNKYQLRNYNKVCYDSHSQKLVNFKRDLYKFKEVIRIAKEKLEIMERFSQANK